jgi:thiamine pyrophosphokinase
MPRTALIFGGALVVATGRLIARLARLHEPFVIAADAGAGTALRLGFVPHVVVGDFDSIDHALLADLKSRGVQVERHPIDKDATDGQLAIERALAVPPDELVLVGFLGGPRLDQELANVLLLTSLSVASVLVDGSNECRLLRSGEAWAWTAEPGELVSLLPLAGDAHGVHTSGLRWRLSGDTLAWGKTRGVSNEPIAEQVRVSLGSGSLLVVRHFPQPPTPDPRPPQ